MREQAHFLCECQMLWQLGLFLLPNKSSYTHCQVFLQPTLPYPQLTQKANCGDGQPHSAADPGDRGSWCEQGVNADWMKNCIRKTAGTMAGKLLRLPCRSSEWEPRPYLIKTSCASIVLGSSLIHTNRCQPWNAADPTTGCLIIVCVTTH